MTKDHCTPFRVPYSDITGDNNSALFLAQLEYWQGIKGNDWVAKSVTDWWNELRLSKKQVARIKSELESLGYIETCLLFFKGSQTTGYCFKKEAVQKALSDGFNAYDKDTIVPKGHDAKRAPSQKGTMPKGNYAPSPKVTMHSTQREPSITENTTENTTDILSDEKISSVPPDLFKSDKLKELAEQAIGKNEQAKPKSKPKKELSPLDKEIAVKIQEVGKRFIKWYEDYKKIAYVSKRYEFSNLTDLFKQLCNNKGYTPDMVVKDIEKIVNGYKKLKEFSQNNFSLNLIATKYNVLLSEIDNYQPPVQKQNFNEPVATTVVKKVHRDTFNGDWLPVGIGKYQFIELAQAIARDKIMNGELPDTFHPYDFTQYLLPTIKDYTPEQVKALLNEYDVK
jgi:hypothetical protein